MIAPSATIAPAAMKSGGQDPVGFIHDPRPQGFRQQGIGIESRDRMQ
jgi:hypothetical protein